MDERLRFVTRLLDGEKMAVVCEEFGISRKTGYKIFERYQDTGLHGLTDRSRRPHRHANQLPMAVEKLIVRLRKESPLWGALVGRQCPTRFDSKVWLRLTTQRIMSERYNVLQDTSLLIPGFPPRARSQG